jgi:Ca-activated chloride channel family protein
MKSIFIRLLAVLIAVMIFGSPLIVARAQTQTTTAAPTQQPSAPNKQDQQLKLSTDLVSLKVTVADSFGRVVTGLRQENFTIYDDKVQQQIAHFTEADAPISIGIIFDISNSMGGIIQSSMQALRRFIETSHEEDDFFLVGFNNHARLVQDFTTSPDQVLGRLVLVKPGGMTALYDAVYLGVEKVQQGRHQKRALLIISDGEENNSRYNEGELRRLIKEAGVQIYAIKIGGPWSYGKNVLEGIAEQTGGRAFVPGYDKGLSFLDICTRIALELRHQYSIGFYPSDARAAIQWHRVQVKITAPKGLGRLSLTYKDRYETFRK